MVDIKKPGAPAGPSGPMWVDKEKPWKNERPDPWPDPPSNPNEGSRTVVPGGGSSGPATNTDVPI